MVASVRHQDTGYDALLMSGVARDLARDRIRPDIDRILASWSKTYQPDASERSARSWSATVSS